MDDDRRRGESITNCRACGAAPRGSSRGGAAAGDLLSAKTTGQSSKSVSKGY
jgi:hypothetical protein